MSFHSGVSDGYDYLYPIATMFRLVVGSTPSRSFNRLLYFGASTIIQKLVSTFYF